MTYVDSGKMKRQNNVSATDRKRTETFGEEEVKIKETVAENKNQGTSTQIEEKWFQN